MKKKVYFLKIILILITIINFYINKNKINKIYSFANFCQKKTNIEYDDNFFQLREVKQQIKKKNLTYIETIANENENIGNMGNALIILNNLINICENIRCKIVIAPGKSLDKIIKNPIFYKEKNIIILPNLCMNKINVDIITNSKNIFYFNFKNKNKYNRLKIIREEVLANIPKFKNTPYDLVINIRSRDVFFNKINKNYGQPPLCFYQKIIDDNKFKNIYLMSNGHENPTVNKLLELYPKIKFIHGTVEEDASVIIYSYNLVMPVSTFPFTLVRLNNNLKKIFVYSLIKYNFKDENFTVYRMEASQNYLNKIQGKWKNTKEQLDLMINENCSNANLSIMI